jgi:hypothetical protein
MRPVCFPLIAAHWTPSQAEEIFGFLAWGTRMSLKIVIFTVMVVMLTSMKHKEQKKSVVRVFLIHTHVE